MSFFDVMMPNGIMLSNTTLIIVVCLMFLYTFVGVVAGFGGALITMPFVTMFIPVKMAAPVSTVVGTATAIYAAIIDRKSVDWRSAIVLIIASFVGVPFGIYLLEYAPDYIMKGVLGIFLVIYAIYSITGCKLPQYDKSWLPLPFGFIAGGLGAAFSTNGPPVVIYATLRNLNKAGFRGTLNAFFAASNIGIIIGMLSSGILTVGTIQIVVLSIPPMVIGWVIGNMVHKKLSQKFFQKVVYILLIISGLVLIKGAIGI